MPSKSFVNDVQTNSYRTHKYIHELYDFIHIFVWNKSNTHKHCLHRQIDKLIMSFNFSSKHKHQSEFPNNFKLYLNIEFKSITYMECVLHYK